MKSIKTSTCAVSMETEGYVQTIFYKVKLNIKKGDKDIIEFLVLKLFNIEDLIIYLFDFQLIMSSELHFC